MYASIGDVCRRSQVFIRRNCCAALCCMTSHNGGRPSLLRPGKGRARGGRNANGSGEHMHHLLHMLARNMFLPWTSLDYFVFYFSTSGYFWEFTQAASTLTGTSKCAAWILDRQNRSLSRACKRRRFVSRAKSPYFGGHSK